MCVFSCQALIKAVRGPSALNQFLQPSLRLGSVSSLLKMSLDSGVSGMRASYRGRQDVFTEDDLSFKEPIGQFKEWFDQARNDPKILEANAMCLATASKDGTPSARYVLLKGFGTDGFKFFTNYDSRKGKELDENPKAALTFYWDVLRRSIRIEGTVSRLSEQESDDYFHSRPRESQIGACASNQSMPISGRDVLTSKEQELTSKYSDDVIPRPKNWGGYILTPHSIEFWQGQSTRLHDRIRFRLLKNSEKPDGKLLHEGENGWAYERLAP